MIVVVFRSRLRPEARDEYMAWAKRMAVIVTTISGYRPLRSNSDPLLRQRLGHPDPSRDRAKPDSHDVVRLVLTLSDVPSIAPEKMRPLEFKVARNISD